MSAGAPVFVVVGNVNQGKSSIVASLSEDGSVPIDAMPGTTVRAGTYVFKVGEETLFTLIDTPGFQDARRALAWMKERSKSPTDRPRAVADFVAAHAASPVFEDEMRLLKPVLEGASILYVVDTSGPPQPSNEAEMEVLRWTGQSRMALLNRTKERDFAGEWRPYLEQYFNVVRTFNAYEAGFEDRMNLLRSFREVREDWRGAMERAIAVIEAEQRSRQGRAAAVLADFMIAALGMIEKKRLGSEEPPPYLKEDLRKAFETAQREAEAKTRTEIEKLYRHARIERSEAALDVAAADLFSDASWRLFGLTRGQLAQYGVAWGAAIGGAIDLMVGGLSIFIGLGIGAAAGGITGYFGGMRVARTWNEKNRLARLLLPGETGRFLCMGPVVNPAFAWMLFDRALVHWRAVSRRSHARKDALDLAGKRDQGEKAGLAAALPAGLRDNVDESLRHAMKHALKGSSSATVREELREAIARVLAQVP